MDHFERLLAKSRLDRRGFLEASGLFVAGAGLLGGCASTPGYAAGSDHSAPTLLFRGGRILTMAPHLGRVEAIAVQGGRIIAIGSEGDVAARAGRGSQVVELGGRTLMPGLIDPHMHMAFVAFEDWLDVSAITTPDFAGVQQKVQATARQTPAGQWVRAQLFDPSITSGASVPSLAMLDQWVPDHPFFMLESNGHIAYVNSQALKLANVSRDTPDPPQARFDRDGNGDLTGRLEETNAMSPFVDKMQMPNGSEMVRRAGNLLRQAASVGCTSLHDCGIGTQAGVNDLTILDAVMANEPPLRYRGMLVSTHMDDWDKLGIKPGRGDDMYRIDGIKAWSDGSNQAFTGYQRENYLGKSTRGALNYTLEQLTDVIRRAHNAGWQVGVHSNGDAAIDTTIQAYRAVLEESPRADHRHLIEHCSVLHPEQIIAMRELGLSPSFLIGHVYWWGKAFRDRILGPDRARFYDPCASALAAGLRISLHSDWNVTPIEPLRYVENAVTRIMHEGGGVFFPEERIPVEAALRAVTLDAAWQCRMDDICGSLEPGKYADFAILEEDPTRVDPQTISKIKVSETWVGGVRKYG